MFSADYGGVRNPPDFVSSSTGSSTNSTVTVTKPAGVQEGDLLVAAISMDSSSVVIDSYPSGFVEVSAYGANKPSAGIAYKIATASEPSSYSFSAGGSKSNNTASIVAYRSATTLNTIGVTGYNASGPAAPSITPTYQGTLVGMFNNQIASLSVSSGPSGMTQRSLIATVTPPSMAVYDQSQQPATATGTKTLTWSGGTSGATAVLMQVTNEPVVAPSFIAKADGSSGPASTTLTINKPTGTQEGDFMIAIMASDRGSTLTWTGDTGWTEIADEVNAPNLRIAYKVAGASEGASYTFTASNSTRLIGSILTYRGAAYDTIGTIVEQTGNTFDLTGIGAAYSQSVLLMVIVKKTSGITFTAQSGGTSAMTSRTSQNANSPSYEIWDQIGTPAGTTPVRSEKASGTSGAEGAAVFILLKPSNAIY